jgi:membrane peptidoglycan carboxypeptidase
MPNGFGGTLAAPIWRQFMLAASQGYCGDFPKPTDPFVGTAFTGPHSSAKAPPPPPQTPSQLSNPALFAQPGQNTTPTTTTQTGGATVPGAGTGTGPTTGTTGGDHHGHHHHG